MRRNSSFVHIRAHRFQRLTDTGSFLYMKCIPGDQMSVSITLVAAHRSLVISCTATALSEFFQYQPGHVGLADIRAGAGYKNFLCHDQSSQSCGL